MTSPHEAHSKEYSRINGSAADLLDRLAIAELCKGWPVYRDNSEWINYRSLFTDDALVWTTWSGAREIDDFIAISKHGKANGAFISHRENGTLVELNPAAGRAVGKMKATITQRFTTATAPKRPSGGDQPAPPPPIVYDVDCDCRFLFFCLRSPAHGDAWKARFVKLVYEKDKVVPVDGASVPRFEPEILNRYPEGYKYLGAAQAGLGYDVDLDLATLDGRFWGRMYACMEAWLDGADDPGLKWETKESAVKN